MFLHLGNGLAPKVGRGEILNSIRICLHDLLVVAERARDDRVGLRVQHHMLVDPSPVLKHFGTQFALQKRRRVGLRQLMESDYWNVTL